MNCEAASIMLTNEREQALEFVVVSGEKKHKLDTLKVPLGEGIAGWVAMNSKPQIVNDTKSDKRFTGKVDDESGFVTRKILAVPMILDKETIGVLEVINTRDGRDFTNDDLRILDDMSSRIATVISATKKIENQQNFYVQTTDILVRAIEKKDIYTEGHSWVVAEYCHKMATVMGLSNTEKNDIHFGALLHDIGKLNLPSFLFNKRILTEREKEIIRQHPVQGAKLLEPITLWKSVVPYVLYHHEAWDGSGYPFGRSGDSIPIGARIINLTEAYSIMRSANSYKPQMTLKESILEIMRASGKQFDPGVVRSFIAILEKENSPR
jgi:putative nucleotidyltransferase with HDIG domain